MAQCLLVGIYDNLGQDTRISTAPCVFWSHMPILAALTFWESDCSGLKSVHLVNSHLIVNFGYCNYFLSTVCFYKVQQAFFQYICKNIHVCSIPLGIYCLETMEATVYSWISWKACSFCKYFSSVYVLICVEVCIGKKNLNKIETREKQSLHICEIVLSEKQL